jgi:ribosomal-protein-alanine N-acetyltransferase
MTETLIRIPTLTTERLVLRAPRMSDLDAFAEFRASDRSVGVGGPFPRHLAMATLSGLVGHWQLRGYGRWMIADRHTDEPLGTTGPLFPEEWPEPEIAWSLFANAEGRGIGYEAASAALAYAYDTLGWTTAISMITSTNIRSAALAKRLGAILDGEFSHPFYGTMGIWRHAGPQGSRP